MNALWQIRGISNETRGKAKAAAAIAGETLGVWVTRAVEKAANEQGGRLEKTLKQEVGKSIASMEGGEGAADVLKNSTPKKARKTRKSEVVKKEKSGPRCKHGVQRGWNCWQCGGLAVMEAAE
jgi:hypothetical protein